MAATASGGLRVVDALRYVLPLREGGSLPGIVECDDLGTYVVKFRGAGQGRKALVAEVVAGELARRVGLPVPELVLVQLDSGMANAEPDEEVQDLLRSSPGTNLGLDYLPGALGLEAAGDVGAELAARVVWFDAYVQNVDRSWRNPNLLLWHGGLWLIDHGAALYWHHSWSSAEAVAARPYRTGQDHVLLPAAGSVSEAHTALAPLVTGEVLRDVLALVPDEWLADEPGFDSADGVREAYVAILTSRLEAADGWLAAVEEQRASRV